MKKVWFSGILSLLVSGGFFALSAASFADDPGSSKIESSRSASKQELLNKLCDCTKIDLLSTEAIKVGIKLGADMLKRSIRRSSLDESIKEEQYKFCDSLADQVVERLKPGPMLREVAINSFDKYFDENDLKVMIAFYDNPDGRHGLQILPGLFEQAAQQAQATIDPQTESLYLQVFKEAEEKGLIPAASGQAK